MFSIAKENDRDKYGTIQYIADTTNDVKDLPTTGHAGSLCIVVEPPSVYMLNNQAEWKKFGG